MKHAPPSVLEFPPFRIVSLYENTVAPTAVIAPYQSWLLALCTVYMYKDTKSKKSSACKIFLQREDFLSTFTENQIYPYDLTSQYFPTKTPYTSQLPHQAYVRQYNWPITLMYHWTFCWDINPRTPTTCPTSPISCKKAITRFSDARLQKKNGRN